MQLSFFEMVKKETSTIIEVVDAFARRELVRLENLINNLATVARTGSYNDLDDKPTIPVVPDISQVGLTGEYNDLLNKPTLFSGDYNDLTNKPTLFSGNYNDLTNKPTIPVVTNSSHTTSQWVYFREHNINGDKIYSGSASASANINTAFGSVYYAELSIALPVNIIPNNIVCTWVGDIIVDVNVKSISGNVITLWLTCPINYNASGYIQFNIE